MSEIVRFEMSGRTFEIDPTAPQSLLDFDVLAETRVNLMEAGSLLTAVAKGSRDPDVEAVRAIGALAYLAAVRAGSNESWREFARAMDPQTIKFVPEPEAPAPPPAPDEAVLAERVLKILEERKTAS